MLSIIVNDFQLLSGIILRYGLKWNSTSNELFCTDKIVIILKYSINQIWIIMYIY